VQARQPILPEGLLHERNSRHEQHLQQQQVARDQTREAARFVEDARRGRQAGDTAVRHP